MSYTPRHSPAAVHDRMVGGGQLPASDPKPSVRKGAVDGAKKGAKVGAVIPVVGEEAGGVLGGLAGARSAKKAGASMSHGNQALTAEFLVCVVILALSSLSSKHSADTPAVWMKRAAATCALFFILALVSAGGPKPAKVAAGFGGVVTLALLLSSGDVFTTLAGMFGGGTDDASAVGDGTTASGNQDVTPGQPGQVPDPGVQPPDIGTAVSGSLPGF